MAEASEATQRQTVNLGGLVARIASLPGAAMAFHLVTNGIHELGDALIGGNAQFETYQTQFASLLHSTDQAQTLISNLARFAAVTPFELPGVIQASKNLLTFGGTTLNTMDNLTLFGNAAAATSNDFGEVTFWAGRAYAAIQAGKPFGEASARLMEMGIMTSQASQKLEALQKAKAPPADLWKAFTEGLQAPSDAMDKLSQTWSGLISTLHDTLAGLGRTIGAPIFAAAKKVLLPFLNFLMGPAVQGAAQALANGIGAALTFIGSGISKLLEISRPVFSFITEGFVLIRDAVLTLGEALSGHWLPDRESIRPFHEAIGELGLLVRDLVIPAFQWLQSVWSNVSGPLGTVVDVVARFLMLGSPFVRILYDIFTNLDAIGQGIQSGGLVGGINAFLDALDRLGPMDEAIAGVLRSLGSLASTVVSIASALASGDFSGAWDAFTTGLSNLWTILSTTAASIGTMLQPIIDSIITWIVTNAPIVGEQLLTWATEFANWIPGAVTNLINAVPGLISSLTTWISDNVQPIIDQLGLWANAFIDWIAPAIPRFLEAVGAFTVALGTALLDALPVIQEKTAQWANALADWVTTVAIPALQGTWGTFLATLEALFASTKLVAEAGGRSSGTATADGFKAGMDPMQAYITVALDLAANTITRYGPAFNLVMRIIAEQAVDAFINFWTSNIPGKIITVGASIANSLISIGPTVIMAAFTLGDAAATALYNAMKSTWETYKGPLLALGVAIAGWVIDGISNMEQVAGYAAGRIGTAILTGITQPLRSLAGIITGILIGGLTAGETAVRAHQQAHSPSRRWAKQVGEPIVAGIAQGAADGAGKMASDITKSVGGALDGATGKLSDKATKLVKSVGSDLLDTANKVFDLVSKAADAFGKLDQFKAPGSGVLSSFFGSVGDAITQAIGLSTQFKVKAVEAGGTFADGASKMLGLISTGADGLSKLVDFVAPSIDSMRMFFDSVEMAVNDAILLAEEFAPKIVEAAAAFADSAGKVLGLVSNGADAFQGLQRFQAPTIASLAAFFDAVEIAVNDTLVMVDDISVDLAVVAGKFAESALSVVKLIGDGTAALATLDKWKAPTIAVLADFFETVGIAVNNMLVVVDEISADLGTVAGTFADSAGKVVGLISDAVTAFASLKRFQAPTIDTLSEFFTAVMQAVNNALAASHGINQGLLDAAVEWADGAGKVLGVIKGAVDALMSVRQYKGILPDQFQLLANDINGVVATMVEIAKNYKSEFLNAATQFSETTGAVMSALKASLDTLAQLKDYKGVAPAAVQLLISDLYGVIGTLQGFFNTIGDALADADIWRTSMENLAATVKAAVEAVTSFADYKGKLTEQGTYLVTDMQYLADSVITMNSLAAITAQNMLSWQLLIQDTVGRVRAGAAAVSSLDGLNIDATVTMGIHTRVRAEGAPGGGTNFFAGGSGGGYSDGSQGGSTTNYEINMNGPVHDRQDAYDGLVDALRAGGVSVG
jgi:hypothetical protein